MTEKETIEIVTLIAMSYPASDRFKDEATVRGMVKIWQRVFREDDPKVVMLAVQIHISTVRYPPSISEIRDQIVKILHPELIPPDEAWVMVAQELDDYNRRYLDPDPLDLLPDLIKRCVNSVGVSNLWEMRRSGRPGMDQAAFMQIYKPLYERERLNAMLPQTIQKEIETRRTNLLKGESNEAFIQRNPTYDHQ